MELIKVSIKLNRTVLLTRIVDRASLTTVEDFVDGYRELFDDQLYGLITNPVNDTAIERLRNGYIGTAVLANRKYIQLVSEYPTTKDIEWVSVTVNTSDRIWHGKAPLIESVGYRGEITDLFSVFKPNQLRELPAEGRRFVAGISSLAWGNLRNGVWGSFAHLGDYTLYVTEVDRKATRNPITIQIFTPVRPGDFDGDSVAGKESPWELRPLSIDDFPSFASLTEPEKEGPVDRSEYLREGVTVAMDSVKKDVTTVMDWVKQTSEYLMGSGRRPGKATALQELTKATDMLARCEAAIAAGKSPDKVMAIRGVICKGSHKVRFVLTYADLVDGTVESILRNILKRKFDYGMDSVMFTTLWNAAVSGDTVIFNDNMYVRMEYII